MKQSIDKSSTAGIEAKFLGKLDDSFYRESLKINDRTVQKLVAFIIKASEKIVLQEEKIRYLKDIYCKTFFSFQRSGKSSSITALIKRTSHIDEINQSDWGQIDWYANHPKRASISGMYARLGMPDREAVMGLINYCTDKKGIFNSRLFSSITGMQNGRDIPDIKKLDELKNWCQTEGKFDLSLFSSVTGMHAGRGIPDIKKLDELKNWCQTDGKFDLSLFSSVTGMQNRKGVPDIKKLDELKNWCQTDGKFDFRLFRRISSIQNGMGIPARDQFLILKANYLGS